MADSPSFSQAPNRPPSNRYLDLIPGYLCMYATIGIMYPFLVMWMKDKGMSDREIAWILGASGLSMIVTSQFWGYIADMVSSPLKILIGTTLGMAAVYLLYPACPPLEARWPWFSVFWAFFGLGLVQSFINTPRPEMLNSLLLRAEGGPENFSWIRAFGSLGYVLLNLPVGYLARGYGLWVQFPIFLVFNLLFVALLLRLRDTPLPSHFERLSFMQLQRVLAGHRIIFVFLLLVLVYQSGHGLSVLYVALYLKELGAGTDTVAWFYSFGAFVEVPLFFFADRLIRRVGPLPLIGFACLCQVARWLIVHFTTDFTILFLSQAFHAITFGLFYASVIIYMTSKTSPAIRSSALTLLSIFFYGLSGMFGNFIGGQIAEWVGLRNFYLFSAGMAAAAFVLLVVLYRMDKSSFGSKT